jgi:hypothetical protein
MKMTHSGAESRIKRITGLHGFSRVALKIRVIPPSAKSVILGEGGLHGSQHTGYVSRDIRATQHTGYKIRDIRAIRLIRDSSWGDVDGIIEEMNEVLAA